MAKMLDALERARQEREKREAKAGQPPPAPAEAEAAPPPPPPTRSEAPEPDSFDAATPGVEMTPTASRPSVHLGIHERVIALHDQQSPITEQIRHVRSNLESVLHDYKSHLIVVSSSVAGEGKTVITANLASTLADAPDDSVLLIDADLRKPDQHNLFGIRPYPGLSELLEGKARLDEVTQGTTLRNLKVIAAGHRPANPTRLLSSARLQNLLHELKQQYRWIMIDTPPMLPVTDAALLARDATGMILVVRMDKTPRKLIERTQNALAEQNIPVLGCILNDYTYREASNGYYNEYYNKYPVDEGHVRS